MSIFDFYQRLKYEETTGTLSDKTAFVIGLVYGVLLVLGLHFFYPQQIKPIYQKCGVVVLGGVSKLSMNRIFFSMYTSKKKLFKEKGLSEDTAFITSQSKGTTFIPSPRS
jgi:hypothetical protein